LQDELKARRVKY
jgi:hypothetical protein